MSRRCRFLAPAVLVALLVVRAVAQNPVPGNAPGGRAPVITGIAVFGNKTTKSEIIMRELTLGVGDSVTVEALQYCQERVYSLGLFNRVSIACPPMDSTVLMVEVDERWFLYPVPLFGTVERDITHWFYGLGVKHENLGGWNEKLFAGFVLGYNPWVSLFYADPWIFGSQQLYFETTLSYQKSVNKSRIAQGDGPDFDESRYGLSGTLGKRLSKFHTLWLEGGYTVVEARDAPAGHLLSERGADRYATLGFGTRYDTRNLKEYATDGMYAAATVRKKGLGFGPVDFTQAVVDVRGYLPLLSRVSLAARSFGVACSGPSIPNYEHQFFGFSERIRGHFEEEVEGENMAGVSVELRYAIVPAFYLYVPDVPVREFATWKLAVYGAVFGDAGMVWNRQDNPRSRSVPHGGGVGLHLLAPYGAVLRVDRAWNEHGAGEWIIDIGTSF
jgi:outer membrane protein assembly factor BamA